jgi:vacuolar-type H+-ATPase catalytic subunit A/Vma1
MAMPETFTSTSTYTTVDIENVFRRFSADIFMIADSTEAITRAEAEEYAHDAQYLATRGYLKKIDLTLLSDGVEMRAVVYRVNESTGEVTSARPGGVRWPKVSSPFFRIIISYTEAYTAEARAKTQPKLKIPWTPSSDDLSHSTLTRDASRIFASNSYGLERDDLR